MNEIKNSLADLFAIKDRLIEIGEEKLANEMEAILADLWMDCSKIEKELKSILDKFRDQK